MLTDYVPLNPPLGRRQPSLYSRQLAALAALDEARIRAEKAHRDWLASDMERDAANAAYNEAHANLNELVKPGAA